MLESLIREFKSPGNIYRGKPFWAWNGKLDAGELRRQVRVLRRMGFGGFFMHSRVGLETPYLSKEWFDCVDSCIDEAGRFGMEAWLYDEDRWPSGAAGGLVTKNPRYRMRSLKLEILDSPKKLKWDREVVAAFAAVLDGTTARVVRRIRKGGREKFGKGEKVLVFRAVTTKANDWYNGFTYLDTMSHEAVREFIKVTHEAYRRNCAGHFGKTVPGMFTDEPNHGEKLDNSMPWTPGLPKTFRKRYGYDLVPHLVELFFDIEGREISQPRYHYHDCVTHLFVDAFARQLGEWCEKNGMLHTGHILEEETLSSQTRVVGSCIRFFEHMQAPGMDILTQYSREYDTAKQVSSAANQFGCKWRLSETYGCTGWDFPFRGHKAVGDWQTALGINLRCHHLSWYTMEGQAKRDYPAGIFYQSPWWELYPKVEDYYSRVHAVMTRGAEVRDLLVIHPVESTWTHCRRGWFKSAEVKKLDRMIMRLRDSFLAGNIDFDYGDEEILSRRARAAKVSGKPVLKVGRASYRAVVVPPLRTIRSTTLELLEKFASMGGKVVFAGKLPRFVDARESTRARELAKRCAKAPSEGEKLVKSVEGECRRLSITDAKGREIPSVLYLLREDAKAFYLFVCNTGHDFRRAGHKDIPVSRRNISLPHVDIRGFGGCAGSPVEMDPDTGDVFCAQAKRDGSGWSIRTELAPVGSRVFVVSKKKEALKLPPRKKLRKVRTQNLAGAKWDVALSEPNAAVLDRPRLRIGKGAWKKEQEVLRADCEVRDALGVTRRGGQMVQPWARPVPERLKKIDTVLHYSFDVKSIPGGELYLGIERPELYGIELNGVPVDTGADCGWWCDKSLRKIRLEPGWLRLGSNEIVLSCAYDQNHPGFESLYLLGSFGVGIKGTSIELKQFSNRLRLGDWLRQGLPFYSGSVAYYREIRPKLKKGERLFVEVPSYLGAAVRILVNGRTAGVIGWEPNEVDITGFVDGKPVTLAIEIIGHRRNSHGPLHLTNKNPSWTGPAQYVTSGEEWTEGYVLKSCGLMAAPKLSVRR